jgi:multiple sugar transport system substrate-binding protein
VIPAFNGTQSAFAASMPGVRLQTFLDEVAYSVPLPSSKNTAAWNTFEAALLPKAFSGQMPVDTALKQLTTEMNGALAKE